MTTTVLDGPSGVPVVIPTPIDTTYNAYTAEYYAFAAGKTIAEVDALGTWNTYIQTCLDMVKQCNLANRVYRVSGAVTFASNYTLQAFGGIAALLSTAALVGRQLVIDNVTNCVVRNLICDGDLLQANTELIYVGHSSRVKLDNVYAFDFASAATSVATAAISLNYNNDRNQVTNCYVENNAVAAGLLSGIAVFTGSGSTIGRGLRLVGNDVNGTNMKQCIVIDGIELKSNRVSDNFVYNSDFTGILYGYVATSLNFNSAVQDNICYNCGGAGIYLNGNDGGPTPGTESKGVNLTGNIVDSCGGQLNGPFANGLSVYIATCNIVGNFVFNTGKTPGGVSRTFYNQTAAINASPAGTTSSSRYNITGNYVDTCFYGIVGDKMTTGVLSANTVTGFTFEGMYAGTASGVGVISTLTITGNSLEGTGIGLQAVAGLTTASYNIQGNGITLVTGTAMRLEGLLHGLCVNNVLNGGTTGILAVGMSAAIGSGFILTDNYFTNLSVGINVATVAGTQLILVGPQYYDSSVATPLAASGTTPGRVYQCSQLGPIRVLTGFANASPAVGEMPGGAKLGDTVIFAARDAGTTSYGAVCTVAGNPGTWNRLLYSLAI